MITIVKRISAIRSRRPRSGAVLVEFMMCFVFLLIMLFGIIQYSLIISSLNTLTQVTREGARYFAVHYSDASANAETVNYMTTVASGSFLQTNDLTLINYVSGSSTTGVYIYDAPSGGNSFTSGTAVTVGITYNMKKRTFFAPFVPGVKSGTNTVYRSTTTLLE
jgi:Flp pilus assembly protein TadG